MISDQLVCQKNTIILNYLRLFQEQYSWLYDAVVEQLNTAVYGNV